MPEDDSEFFKQEMIGVTPFNVTEKAKVATSGGAPSDSQLARRASAVGGKVPEGWNPVVPRNGGD